MNRFTVSVATTTLVGAVMGGCSSGSPSPQIPATPDGGGDSSAGADSGSDSTITDSGSDSSTAEAGSDTSTADGGTDGSAADSSTADGGNDAADEGDGDGSLDAPDEGDGDGSLDAPDEGDGDGSPDAPDAGGAIAVSAGYLGNACAVTAGGVVKCWTYKGSGITATPVTGFVGEATAVSAGGGADGYFYDVDAFYCAITAGGGVECWGQDVDGELGNGTTVPSNGTLPVTVAPGLVMGLTSGVTAISAGAGDGVSVCAVSAGNVWCWGNNNGGVFGNGTTANMSSVPVQVGGFASAVTAVSVGDGFACAIVTGGGVECWGGNNNGQLGNGTVTNSLIPVPVTGLTSGVTAISAGKTTACAVTAGGGVKCWGYGVDGELGNGATGNSNIPVQVSGLTSGATSVSVTYASACALTGGGVQCWGYGADGELGNNSTTSSNVPVPVATLSSGVTAVSVGYALACAVTVSGQVWCWGNGQSTIPFRITGF